MAGPARCRVGQGMLSQTRHPVARHTGQRSQRPLLQTSGASCNTLSISHGSPPLVNGIASPLLHEQRYCLSTPDRILNIIKGNGVARTATFLRYMPWPIGRKSVQRRLGAEGNGGSDRCQLHEMRHQETALIATASACM